MKRVMVNQLRTNFNEDKSNEGYSVVCSYISM
jgi:hypothetical protein